MFVTVFSGLGVGVLKSNLHFSAHSTGFFSPILQTLACPCNDKFSSYISAQPTQTQLKAVNI